MYLKLDSNLPILYRRRCSAARCKRYRCERAMGARCSCSAYAPLLRRSRLQCETGVRLLLSVQPKMLEILRARAPAPVLLGALFSFHSPHTHTHFNSAHFSRSTSYVKLLLHIFQMKRKNRRVRL